MGAGSTNRNRAIDRICLPRCTKTYRTLWLHGGIEPTPGYHTPSRPVHVRCNCSINYDTEVVMPPLPDHRQTERTNAPVLDCPESLRLRAQISQYSAPARATSVWHAAE